MPNYSKNEIILVHYPFSDLSSTKVRPAIIINARHLSQDLFIVPLTSKISKLLSGEFLLSDWKSAGLNVPTAVKRGLYTVHAKLVIKTLGTLTDIDSNQLEKSLREWLDLAK